MQSQSGYGYLGLRPGTVAKDGARDATDGGHGRLTSISRKPKQGNQIMIELVMNIAMFVLVLFVVLPVLGIVLLAMREVTYRNYRHCGRHREQDRRRAMVLHP